jgi:hypothetical protein
MTTDNNDPFLMSRSDMGDPFQAARSWGSESARPNVAVDVNGASDGGLIAPGRVGPDQFISEFVRQGVPHFTAPVEPPIARTSELEPSGIAKAEAPQPDRITAFAYRMGRARRAARAEAARDAMVRRTHALWETQRLLSNRGR